MKTKQKEDASNDDSFWDIGKTFVSKVRKPNITFGQKRASRVQKKPATVNIFSSIKKSSLIVKHELKSKEEEDVKDKKRNRNLKQQIERQIETPNLDFKRVPNEITTRSPERTSALKNKDEPTKSSIRKPPKKQTSDALSTKETAISKTLPIVKELRPITESSSPEALVAGPTATATDKKPEPEPPVSESSSPSKPILSGLAIPEASLSRKSMVLKPGLSESVLPGASTSSSSKPPQSELTRLELTPSKSLVNENITPIVPMKRDKGKGRAVAEKPKISLSKKKLKPITYLQSTPSRSQKSIVQASDIFGDLALSPIAPSRHQSVLATPQLHHPQQSVIPINGKAIPQPPSPTRLQQSTPVISLTDIMHKFQAVSDQEKKMKVEDYLNHVIDKSITKVKTHGQQIVQRIQEKSDLIKQELQQHLD